jgi:5'-nucleotidase
VLKATPQVVLNVSFPKPNKRKHSRKICRQAKSYVGRKFDKVNPTGTDYYWLAGEFINMNKGRHG